MTLRLTAFARYDRLAASTRQRLLQYVPALEQAGVDVDYRPLLGDDYVASIAGGRRYAPTRIGQDYLRRLREIALGPLGDAVWVYAELFPHLPAAFERMLIARRRPIVVDFDDAFFHAYDYHRSPLVRAMLGGKLEPLLRAASACTCGNAYLRDYAAQYCANSIIVPTTVDTDRYVPAAGERVAPPVIGWIGSPSTWQYMHPLLPILEEMVLARRARVLIVGAGAGGHSRDTSALEFVDWSEASEVAEIQRMDIGIMPLPDDPWARGKSGYKLIQYMACGLPVVASPVGVNREIVQDGVSGLLASSHSEWRDALDRLLADSGTRARMGAEGRRRAVADYSLQAHAPRVVEVIRSAAGSRPMPVAHASKSR
ncbi:glycosyltransferase family 4 protein [Sphingomonas sp.]|uniref:glycosyltransferase family 4 protein n=1 Tax=Sphingomonas sp. TaxID=28214 RepID=UPI0025E13093|nr:glycosyltransferase family 4 protein [Sphingomonas sp.]MBV9528568.1 glycosyltransferase family 4 protein [Sphingomonas sp.]